MSRRAIACIVALGLLVSCGAEQTTFKSAPQSAVVATAPPAPSDESASFGFATPESVGMDSRKLSEVTAWVEKEQKPIFSVLISRAGKLVYELYSSHITREQAHYVMSVTKSVTSALVGIAIDQKLVVGDDVAIADALPAALFPSESDRARFKAVTLHQVLGMSALDAQVPPHEKTDASRARQKAFLASDNRARFALGQALLPEPGTSFQYTDITPYVAGATVTYSAHQTLYDFALANLYGPLGFRNTEWMHEDAAGNDNAAYGVRLRPIDMQKFGVLYLRGGDWNGRRVLSESWVKKSFEPWIRSKPHFAAPNYGNYFWTQHFGGLTTHVANGWKGQRIAIVPSKNLVVTMTALLEEDEEPTFKALMEMVVNATSDQPLSENPQAFERMKAQIQAANAFERIPSNAEPRMVPAVAQKERHHPLASSR